MGRDLDLAPEPNAPEPARSRTSTAEIRGRERRQTLPAARLDAGNASAYAIELDRDVAPSAVFLITADARHDNVDGLAEALLCCARRGLMGCLRGLELPGVMAAISHDRRGSVLPAELVLCPDADGVIAVMRPLFVHGRHLHDAEVAGIVHDLHNPLATLALDAGLLTELQPSRPITAHAAALDLLVQDLLAACATSCSHAAQLACAIVRLRA